MCEKLEHTVNLSEQISSINIERREEDKKTTEEALTQIKQKKEESFYSTLVHNDNWHGYNRNCCIEVNRKIL